MLLLFAATAAADVVVLLHRLAAEEQERRDRELAERLAQVICMKRHVYTSTGGSLLLFLVSMRFGCSPEAFILPGSFSSVLCQDSFKPQEVLVKEKETAVVQSRIASEAV